VKWIQEYSRTQSFLTGFKLCVIHAWCSFPREHLGLLDERTRLKDIDVQDPVCDEFYQTWMKSAERNIDLFDEVPFSFCLFLSLSVGPSLCPSVSLSVCLCSSQDVFSIVHSSNSSVVYRKFVIILYKLTLTTKLY